MLQCIDAKIIEVQNSNHTFTMTGGSIQHNAALGAQNYAGSLGSWYTSYYPPATIYWNSYPVYVCTDKTAKAIEILKKLQAEKQLEVKSVPRFIELVEMIAGIL